MKIAKPRRAVHGILLLDKPLGLSSNEALQRAKRLYRAEKAGHTGSLDPLATGMLPLCFGTATKLCGQLLDSDKRYVAVAKLGEKTATGDAEGQVIARSDPSQLRGEQFARVLSDFAGVIQQTPPMYSALKHQGQRLYDLARQGLEVERSARSIEIHELKLLRFQPGEFELEVRCSKGTYIRTLVEDIAQALGQCAHLRALRRLEVSPFAGFTMHNLEAVQAAADHGDEALAALILPPAAALSGWATVRVDDVRAQRLRQGLTQRVAGAPRNAQIAVQDARGALLCLAETDQAGVLSPRRWLAPD